MTPASSPGSRALVKLVLPASLWLVVGSALALGNVIQAHDPAFMAACPVLNYGRLQAMAESALVYGWLGNAGLALGLWLLGRLGGEPLRGRLWLETGALFWNLGILLGLVGIGSGEATALPFLELPRAVLPLLLAAYGAIAIGGILAWTGRRRQALFASQWYAVAPLFLFPWVFSAAQVMLLWFPVRGVEQAVVSAWFAQSLWCLGIAPFVLACAYYLVPKITGRVIPGYELAPAGFWCLIFIGPFLAGRQLIGGPVPAWIGSMGVVTAVVLLFHYLVVGINFRPALLLFGAPKGSEDATSLRFVALGLGAYLLGGLIAACASFRGWAERLQFTWFDQAEHQLALAGAASLVFAGALYYAVPRMAGRPLFSTGLRRAHFAAAAAGLILVVVGLAAAGCTQGAALADPKASFGEIADGTRPWLLAATLGQALLLLGSLFLVINLFKTAACPFYAASTRAGGGASSS